GVGRVVGGDDRVEVVVTARELDNDKHGILLHRRHLAFLRSRQSSCVTQIDTRASPQSVAAVRRYVWWPPGRSPPCPSGSRPIPSPARPAPSWCRRRLPPVQANRGTNRPAPPAPRSANWKMIRSCAASTRTIRSRAIHVCLHRGPLSLDYLTPLPGQLWRSMRGLVGVN